MMNEPTNIEDALAKAESIGTIGSPSTTNEIKMNIRGAAAENKIVGEYAILKYRQQGDAQFALGQITEVRLRNRMLEDHTILTLARQRGTVDHVSDHQDTHEGDLHISATYRQTSGATFRESSMGTVPPTGTDIKKATNSIINEIIKEHQDNVFYLGTAYQSNLDFPMWFRQFNGAPGQLGEAHHIGIFGRSGSGKSTLAKLILLAYATHPEMGILIIDPQGEFASSINGEKENFDIDLKKRLENLNRETISIDVDNIVLNRWELVSELLAESEFVMEIGLARNAGQDLKETVATRITDALRKQKIALRNLSNQESFNTAIEAITEAVDNKHLYATASPNQRIKDRIALGNLDSLFRNHWEPLTQLFSDRSGSIRTNEVIEELLRGDHNRRPIVNINLAHKGQNRRGIRWNDKIQNIVINQVLSDLERAAERSYQDGQSLNTMVVIDEAHRLAPQNAPDETYAQRIKSRLADSARTTRKYGLGWMFISQSLASMSTDIVRQTRIQFFGHGLSMGSELSSLRELVGGDSNKVGLYQSFKDPESAFSSESKEYSFMAAGPVSPLCLTATPIFLNVYNNPETFLEKNRRYFSND